MHLMWLNCHPISKPAEATVPRQRGLQMEYKKSTSLVGDELMPFPLLLSSLKPGRQDVFFSQFSCA